jgi:hypothetical protein
MLQRQVDRAPLAVPFTFCVFVFENALSFIRSPLSFIVSSDELSGNSPKMAAAEL